MLLVPFQSGRVLITTGAASTPRTGAARVRMSAASAPKVFIVWSPVATGRSRPEPQTRPAPDTFPRSSASRRCRGNTHDRVVHPARPRGERARSPVGGTPIQPPGPPAPPSRIRCASGWDPRTIHRPTRGGISPSPRTPSAAKSPACGGLLPVGATPPKAMDAKATRQPEPPLSRPWAACTPEVGASDLNGHKAQWNWHQASCPFVREHAPSRSALGYGYPRRPAAECGHRSRGSRAKWMMRSAMPRSEIAASPVSASLLWR